MSLAEKDEYKILVSVVLKHHEKEKSMRKKAKEAQLVKDFEKTKQLETENLFKAKLKESRSQQDHKAKQLNQRIKKLDTKKEELVIALEEYKNEKQELNTKRNEKHQKKMKKLSKER